MKPYLSAIAKFLVLPYHSLAKIGTEKVAFSAEKTVFLMDKVISH